LFLSILIEQTISTPKILLASTHRRQTNKNKQENKNPTRLLLKNFVFVSPKQ